MALKITESWPENVKQITVERLNENTAQVTFVTFDNEKYRKEFNTEPSSKETRN